jgi:hypothetical protein
LDNTTTLVINNKKRNKIFIFLKKGSKELIDKSYRKNTVVALEDTEVAFINKVEFDEIL